MKVVASWEGTKPSAEELFYALKKKIFPLLGGLYYKMGPQEPIEVSGFDSKTLQSTLTYVTDRAQDAIAFIAVVKNVALREFGAVVDCEVMEVDQKLLPFLRRMNKLENVLLQAVVELARTRKILPNKSIREVRYSLERGFGAEMDLSPEDT